MWLKRITFHRFKQFRDQTLEMRRQPITLVGGGNNSGKSSILHGLAVWEFCRTAIEAERGLDAFLEETLRTKRQQGKGMGDEEFSPINVPSLNHLWTNLRAQRVDEPDGYTLQIGAEWEDDGGDRQLEFALALANDRLFLRVNRSNLEATDRIPRVAYLPPFAGITDREMRLPGAIRRRRIGEGLAGAVLRNLLLDMYQRNTEERRRLRGDRSKVADNDLRILRETDPWELLQDALRRTFSAQLVMSPFREEYHSYIRVDVEKGDVTGYKLKRYPGYNKRDLMVEGSGFLQWLSVYALATSPDVDILLLDEPDAHLHVSLQKALLERLEELAERTEKRVLVATHSSELLRTATPPTILEMRTDAAPRYLSIEHQKVGLLAGLGTDYAPRLDRIRETRHVFFTEGPSDAALLKILAGRLGLAWPDKWVEWQWSSGHKERKQLYLALKEEIGDVVALSLVDRDDTPIGTVGPDLKDKSFSEIDRFHCRRWRRRNIESYLLWPPAIAAAAEMTEAAVRDAFADRFALAIPTTFSDADVPQTLLDANGKEILKSGPEAILGQLDVGPYEVAAAFDAPNVCADIRLLIEQLTELADVD